LASRFLSERARSVPESGVRAMFNKAQKLKDVINLTLGEPDFKTPTHIIEAANRAMMEGYTHYTPNVGLVEFREAAAQKLRRENRIDVDPETEVMATVGSMGALSLTMLALIDPGDEVLIPSPGFASYKAQVLMAGGRPVEYKLDEDTGFQPDIEELSRLITKKTKAILINSPSNPTGSVFSESLIRGIADLARDRDILVISDEAYERIVYDGNRHLSPASLPGMMERTISLFTLSKTYAMTGWRIGYAVADKEIIAKMTKLQEHLVAHPSSISQLAAASALTGPDECVKEMVREYKERRNLVMRQLSAIDGLRCFKPKGAFYAFPNIRAFGMRSEDLAMYLLEKAKVVTVPGSAFGSFGEGYIRISYATSKEKLSEAIGRMREALEDLT